MAYLCKKKKKKKSFTTIQHICNMCVFQYACIVYINFAPPSSQILAPPLLLMIVFYHQTKTLISF